MQYDNEYQKLKPVEVENMDEEEEEKKLEQNEEETKLIAASSDSKKDESEKETPYLNLFNTKLNAGFSFNTKLGGALNLNKPKERKESNASSNDFDRDESESPLEE